MKKILSLVAVAALFCALLLGGATPSLAAEPAGEPAAVTTASPVMTTAAVTTASPVMTTAAVTTAAPATAAPSDGGADDEPVPISEALLAFFGEHAAELASGATFLLTLLLTLFFKKSLMPPLLSALSTLVAKNRETAAALTAGEEASARRTEELLAKAESLLAVANGAARRAEEVTESLAREGAGKDALFLALREEGSLLYELLMSANLPQYQKDRIGEHYAEIRAVLERADHE